MVLYQLTLFVFSPSYYQDPLKSTDIVGGQWFVIHIDKLYGLV